KPAPPSSGRVEAGRAEGEARTRSQERPPRPDRPRGDSGADQHEGRGRRRRGRRERSYPGGDGDNARPPRTESAAARSADQSRPRPVPRDDAEEPSSETGASWSQASQEVRVPFETSSEHKPAPAVAEHVVQAEIHEPSVERQSEPALALPATDTLHDERRGVTSAS